MGTGAFYEQQEDIEKPKCEIEKNTITRRYNRKIEKLVTLYKSENILQEHMGSGFGIAVENLFLKIENW